MIRILIADAQYLILEGLRSLIRDDERMEIVGEVQEASDLPLLIEQVHPEVLIMDHSSLKDFKIDMFHELMSRVNILIITSDQDKDSIRGVLGCGVTGFLFKDCAKSEVLDAVVAVANNQKFYCKQVLDKLLRKDLKEDDFLPTSLTSRETEIVKLMALGLSTPQIASKLSLSKHTIYTHRKNIFKKLGLNSATEVVRFALRTGLVKSYE